MGISVNTLGRVALEILESTAAASEADPALVGGARAEIENLTSQLDGRLAHAGGELDRLCQPPDFPGADTVGLAIHNASGDAWSVVERLPLIWVDVLIQAQESLLYRPETNLDNAQDRRAQACAMLNLDCGGSAPNDGAEKARFSAIGKAFERIAPHLTGTRDDLAETLRGALALPVSEDLSRQLSLAMEILRQRSGRFEFNFSTGADFDKPAGMFNGHWDGHSFFIEPPPIPPVGGGGRDDRPAPIIIGGLSIQSLAGGVTEDVDGPLPMGTPVRITAVVEEGESVEGQVATATLATGEMVDIPLRPVEGAKGAVVSLIHDLLPRAFKSQLTLPQSREVGAPLFIAPDEEVTVTLGDQDLTFHIAPFADVVHAIVLDPQEGPASLDPLGEPYLRYPFGEDVDPADVQGRRIFIVGRDLPLDQTEVFELFSADPAIHYEVYRFPRDAGRDDHTRQLFFEGRRRFAALQRQLVALGGQIGGEEDGALDYMIVEARLSEGALPGPRTLLLNGPRSPGTSNMGTTGRNCGLYGTSSLVSSSRPRIFTSRSGRRWS